MKTISANPNEVQEALKAMAPARISDPLVNYFPLSDIENMESAIEFAKTNREMQNLRFGNLTTTWVCEVEEKQEWLNALARLRRMIEKNFTIGDAIEANFGVSCRLGVKRFCLDVGRERYMSIWADGPTSPLSRGLTAKAADRLGY